jgi:hypothetical protein
MASLEILDEARAAGLDVVADGDELVVRGPRRLADLVRRVLASKVELLAELRQVPPVEGKAAPAELSINRSPLPAERPRRLIGNGFAPIPTAIPPDSIVATPRVVCPYCDQGAVLPELRELTGQACYRCWLKMNSPAPHSSPRRGTYESGVIPVEATGMPRQ